MNVYGPPTCNNAELEFHYLITKNDETSTEQYLSKIFRFSQLLFFFCQIFEKLRR